MTMKQRKAQWRRCCAALLLAGAGAAASAAPAPVLLDRIAIIVDDDVIMVSEIRQRMQVIKAQLAASGATRVPSDAALREQIMERLIVESLQLQIGERSGVKISDDELNRTLASIAEQNGMSLDEFRETMVKDGMSWQDTREQIRREMIISRVQQGIMRRRIDISAQEIDNFLRSDLGLNVTSDEFKLGHILIAFPENPGPRELRAAKERADLVLERLEAGGDFGSLAVEFSNDQNALEGGEMDWRKPGQMPTIFAGLVEGMAVGDVKGPVRSGSGYHIIKLLNRRGAEAQGQIAQTRVRHLLIKPNEIRTVREARELAGNLRREVVEEGRDFAELARLHSDDPGSALSGGDLGWTRAGVFVPEFEVVMQATDEGEVSEVFRSEHGFHFLEVTGRRTEDFSEQFKMGQAENFLRNQRFDEELESWIREIRGDAFVEIRI